METPARNRSKESDPDAGVALGRIREALRGLHYGEVRIVVHDGDVVQVERTERLRLVKGRTSGSEPIA